jgi:prevent-host-death family protein
MEINASQDVKPISDFRKDCAKVLKRLKETKKPVLLTQNGRSVAVLLDVEEYEAREYDRLFSQAIAEGLSDIAHGRTHSHAEVMKELDDWAKKPRGRPSNGPSASEGTFARSVPTSGAALLKRLRDSPPRSPGRPAAWNSSRNPAASFPSAPTPSRPCGN